MSFQRRHIQILSAPSILGLRHSGVELLAQSLLQAGLAEQLNDQLPVIHVPTLNDRYNPKRDPVTQCLNPGTLREFSLQLGAAVDETVQRNRFVLVLGGDCSILLGILSALQPYGPNGLIFIDAHADFYSPETSVTGEAADMDLALVTGHGPSILTDINGREPYIQEKNVIHIGQRDEEETILYGSPDIRETAIRRFPLQTIREQGMTAVTTQVLGQIDASPLKNYWIHFDMDVLSDELNPAVDYRLPGGLRFDEVEHLLRQLLLTGKITGMSITVFNPQLDEHGLIAAAITESLGRAFP